MKKIDINRIRRIQDKLNKRIFIPDDEINRVIHSFRDLLLPDGYEDEINWDEVYRKKYYVFRTDSYCKNRIRININHIIIHSLSETRFLKRVSTADLSLDLVFQLESVPHGPAIVCVKSLRKTKIKLLANYNVEVDDFYFHIYSRKYNWNFSMFVAFPHSNSESNQIVYLIFKLLYPLIIKILEVCADEPNQKPIEEKNIKK